MKAPRAKGLTAEDIAAAQDGSAPDQMEAYLAGHAAGFVLGRSIGRLGEEFRMAGRLSPEWRKKRVEQTGRRKGGAVTAQMRKAEAASWKKMARQLDAAMHEPESRAERARIIARRLGAVKWSGPLSWRTVYNALPARRSKSAKPVKRKSTRTR